jgi:long-chain acyl-CoA synthetase
MPNILQYPVAICAVLRAGFTVVNINPLYTAHELETQLKDAGAEAIIVLENFARVPQQAIGKTSINDVVVASVGDLLGMIKGTIVNLVARQVKKMVPAYSPPGATPFNAALAAGKSMNLTKPQFGSDDLAFLQYTDGPRASPKARCCCIATWSPTCCRSTSG